MSAWRMRHHQIPAVAEHILYWSLVVRAIDFGGQQIAAHSKMPVTPESITDTTGVFASD